MSKRKFCYLAGGMEKAKHNGKVWRKNITPLLKEQGWTVLNPCKKEFNVFKYHGLHPTDLGDMPKQYHQDVYRPLFKDIVFYDIELIEDIQAIIVYYDESVNLSSGTTSEMTIGRMLRIPILVVKNVPYSDIPGWTIGCIDECFNTFKECVDFLDTPEFQKLKKEVKDYIPPWRKDNETKK